ncbi:MAG: hypothetical protein ABW076_00695 [Candidatus Thiodiazotropha sp.]
MKEMNPRYISMMQARTAQVAIGHSTLRNQGAPDVIATARSYLSKVDLSKFAATESEEEFLSVLNKRTKSLADRFPGEAKGNWGAARKALNIFLRDCLYNRYLAEHFGLVKLECWLEIPLDGDVGNKLREKFPEILPKWKTIKRLTPGVSQQFQEAAAVHAVQEQVCKVLLDLKFWRNGGQNN